MVSFLTLLQNYVYNERGFKGNSAQNRLSQHAKNRFNLRKSQGSIEIERSLVMILSMFAVVLKQNKTKTLSLEGLHCIFSWSGQLYELLVSQTDGPTP